MDALSMLAPDSFVTCFVVSSSLMTIFFASLFGRVMGRINIGGQIIIMILPLSDVDGRMEHEELCKD